jgi:predicted transcriptional regulator
MSPEFVRRIMEIDFTPQDRLRVEHLSEKAQADTLTVQEAAELDGYLQVDSLLSILRLKAERFLNS